MAANRNTDLLAPDSDIRADPSKRILAGLSSRRGSRMRLRAAAVAVVSAFALFALGVAVFPHGSVADQGAGNSALPPIPFDRTIASLVDISKSFKVSTPPPWRLRSLAVTDIRRSGRAPVARNARRGNKAASMDVAILSVLVEHIDAERRANRMRQRGVK